MKKLSTGKIIALVLLGLFILGFASCVGITILGVATVSEASNEIEKKEIIKENEIEDIVEESKEPDFKVNANELSEESEEEEKEIETGNISKIEKLEPAILTIKKISSKLHTIDYGYIIVDGLSEVTNEFMLSVDKQSYEKDLNYVIIDFGNGKCIIGSKGLYRYAKYIDDNRFEDIGINYIYVYNDIQEVNWEDFKIDF